MMESSDTPIAVVDDRNHVHIPSTTAAANDTANGTDGDRDSALLRVTIAVQPHFHRPFHLVTAIEPVTVTATPIPDAPPITPAMAAAFREHRARLAHMAHLRALDETMRGDNDDEDIRDELDPVIVELSAVIDGLITSSSIHRPAAAAVIAPVNHSVVALGYHRAENFDPDSIEINIDIADIAAMTAGGALATDALNTPRSLPSSMLSTDKPDLATVAAVSDRRQLTRIYAKVVSLMLDQPQWSDEWQLLDTKREALQQRIDELSAQQRAPGRYYYDDYPRSRYGDLSPHSHLLDMSHDHYASMPSFTCPICLETHPSYTGVLISSCQHYVCSSCLTGYLTSTIMDGVIAIHCPCVSDANHSPCTSVLSSNLILAYTSHSHYLHYVKLCEMKSNSNLRECPKCQHKQRGSNYQRKIACQQCQFVYCFKHASAHTFDAPLACRRYERELRRREKLSLSLIADTSVECPQCHAPVFKTEGCNHLSCRCGAEFCYLCGSGYQCGMHFASWNVFIGCPSLQHYNGSANERKTLYRQLCRGLVGWPLLLTLIPLLIFTMIVLFLAIEALWLGLFLALLPLLLVAQGVCSSRLNRLHWSVRDRFYSIVFFGPVLARKIFNC